MKAWHEDDCFWQESAPWLFRPARWESAGEEVEQLIVLLDLASGASVLDMGCGPGRHSLELAKRGFRVTGVDRTSMYLSEASMRAQEIGVQVEWVQADMREFKTPGTFDAAINLFTAFGYFEEKAEDRRVLENLLASLKPNGKLVIDLMGKEVLARIFQARDWELKEDGSMALYERNISQDWSWVENTWILVREGKFQKFQLGHRLYSAAELKGLLESVGFAEVKAFGGLDGSPYDHQAKRLVVVAQRRRDTK